MLRWVVLLAILGSAATASADDYYPEPLPPQAPPAPVPVYVPTSTAPAMTAPQPVVYAAPDPDEGPKSPGTAGMLSFFATVGPPLAAAAAFGNDDGNDREDTMITVMLGSVLVGPSIGHLYAGKLVTPGLGVRALGFALGLAAAGTDDLDDAIGLLLLGSGCVIGGAVYDIATAGRSAREYNFQQAKRMMPTFAPVTTNGQPAGVQVGLAGAF